MIMMIPKRSLHIARQIAGRRGGHRYRGHLPPLLSLPSNNQLIQHRRSFVSLVGVIRSVLKIRYIILGSAVGGGIHANNVCFSFFRINFFLKISLFFQI